MTRRRLLGAAASVAAIALALTVPTVTTAAWTADTTMWALSHVAPFDPPGTVDPPPPPPPPPPPAATGPLVAGENTVITDVSWTFPAQNQGSTCVAFQVASTTGAADWSFSFLRSQAPLWGGTGIWVEGGGTVNTTLPDRIDFVPAGWVTDVARTMSVCMSATSPPIQPDRFESSQSAPVWETDRACFDVSVRGTENLASYPFFFRWSHVVDLRAALQLVRDHGGTASNVTFTSPGSVFSNGLWTAGLEEVEVVSTTVGAIRGDQERVIRVCAID